MNSHLKRFLAFTLALVLVLGILPAVPVQAETQQQTVTAPKKEEAGMFVNVDNSQITIQVNKIGTSGTATLYRVAADQYMAGDELTGKSKQLNTVGTVIGEYSCGSSQTFTINRYLNDGSDNLYDKYYLVQNGNILAGPVYATEIASQRSKPAFVHASKKGVTLEDETTINIAKEMGATNTVINWNLAEMLVATEDANGNPRDLSKRTDLMTYECNGKTYYFKSDYVKAQDGLISAYSKAGMNVTLVVIAWAKTLTADYPRSLMYWNQTNRQTLAYNTANDRGMEYWIAAMEFMADRYSKSANMGLIDKFVIGNEIDYTYDWYLIEPLQQIKVGDYTNYFPVDFDVFMEEFARTFRLANLAVKKYNSEAKVCVSLTHNWALNSAEAYNQKPSYVSVRHNSYAPKDIVDWLVEVEGARGDYNWGLAVHPYAVGTNSSNPVKTDVAGTYGKPITGNPDTTPWITVANLEMYQLYLQRPENMYNGTELRTVSLTETTVLSTKSTDSYYATSIQEQAASIAMTYYRAVSIPCIDQMAYFQVHDQTTTNYMVGLMTSNGVKKPAYDVWKYIDTDKTFVIANKYLKYISSTATSYKDLMPAVKSDFDWNAAWDEDKIIYRQTEGGDTVRDLSTNKSQYKADDLILVTAKGDLGDTVELYLASDNVASAQPIYSYPVMGENGVVTFRSGGTYDLVSYGEVNLSRLEAAKLKAGNYRVVLRRGDTGAVAKHIDITITGNYSIGGSNHDLITDKTTYASGEEIIVSAAGGENAWVGLYKKGDKYGSGSGTVTSIFWYNVNEPSVGQLPGKPSILQNGIHNASSSNPGMTLSPGEYVLYLFRDGGYSPVTSVDLTVTAAQITALTGVNYKLDNDTDGFANGVVTVTKDAANAGATHCVMYWADANGKPLTGYGPMASFKLDGVATSYRMPSHMIIPAGAKKLNAYASNGTDISAVAVSVNLPAGSDYVISGNVLAEFQVVSDIHVTLDNEAGGEVTNSNKHFGMMLDDVIANSPNSIGIFAVGDIANNGKAAEYQKALQLYYSKPGAPGLHLAVGNHDWYSGNPNKQFQMYASLFNSDLSKQPDTTYYDETVGGYHFVYLGGEDRATNGVRVVLSDAQLAWFDSRMAEFTKEDPNKPVFVMLHQSFYNTVAGSLPGQGWDGVVNEGALKAVMKKYGQIVLFNGHSHWTLDSFSNMFPGDTDTPVALNTGSVSYLWTSENIASGEFLYGSQGYYVRVYQDKTVILGRDFVNGVFLPSATYVIQRNQITGVQDEYDIFVNQAAVNLGAKAQDGSPVHYASSNNDVVIVTADGTLIPKAPGTATITITADSTSTAVIAKKQITINVTENTQSYMVVFKDWDGRTISSKSYRYGEQVTIPASPTRAEDNTATYTFAGWDKPVVNCTGNATYTAKYNATYKNYTVTFKNWDGSTISSKTYHWGDQVAVPTNPTKAADNTYTYAFKGWDKAVAATCAGNAIYTAQFTSTYKNYTVKFLNWNGQVISEKTYHWGDKITVPANPTRAEDADNTYTFSGWDKTIAANCAGNATYTAKYTATPKIKPYTGVTRVFGATRYDTAFDAANMLKERLGVQKFETIIVACGTDFADALSGSYLANQKNAPILLVRSRNQEINQVKAYIKANLKTGGTVYLLGGVNAVPKSMETGLEGFTVKRLAGATRYETSLAILKEAGVGNKDILVCTGKNFADGLSASAVNMPIMLVKDSLTATQKAFLQGLNGNKIVIIGGTVAVNTRIENALKAYGTVERIEGATRYYTSVNIAKKYFPNATTMVVAYADNFPDGLSGGPLAYSLNAPLILTMNGKQAVAANYAKEKKISSGVVLGGTTLISDKVVKAIFGTAKPTYMVSYVLGGGQNNAQNPAQYTVGQGAALHAPVREHYIFRGWYLDAAFHQKIDGITTSQTGNLVLHAKWEPEQYTITYELNGGTNASANPGKYTFGTAVTFGAPTKAHYVFKGWYKEAGFVNKVESVKATDYGNLVLYAKWEPEQYTITYELNGGTNAAGNPSWYAYGDTVRFADPVKENYVFVGWYLDAAFTQQVESIAATDFGDLKLYAKWQAPVAYNITYVLDGGRNSSRNPDTYYAGETIALQGASKTYNTFDGWYKDAAFTVKVTQIGPEDVGDLTLYAKWVPFSYTIEYVLNNGENNPNNPEAYNYGTAIVLGTPTRSNHTFKGWYTDAAFKNPITEIPANHAGDVKLYAKWNLSQLNIQGEGMENMIWSWWYYPQVVSTADTVYWGYATNEGYSGVAAHDIATGKVTTNHLKRLDKVDDHNGLSVTQLKDGRIMCIYAGGHDSNNEIHVRISEKPNSIEKFSTDIVLTSAGKTCYGQVIQQNGRIYVFYRVNSKNWAYRSTEDGINWTEEIILVRADAQYYLKVVPTTQEGLLRVCMTSNPTATDPQIRMAFLNLNTGMMYNSNRTTELGTKDVSAKSVDILLTPPQGKIQRLFDVAITAPEQVRILYTVFSNSKTANDSAYYLYDSGKSVKICDGGVPLWNPKYQGGASFADDSTIVLCRNAGNKDFVEVYTYNGTAMRLSKSVYSESTGSGTFRNARPIVDVNGKFFLWHRGYYNPKVYTDFDTDAMIGTVR